MKQQIVMAVLVFSSACLYSSQPIQLNQQNLTSQQILENVSTNPHRITNADAILRALTAAWNREGNEPLQDDPRVAALIIASRPHRVLQD